MLCWFLSYKPGLRPPQSRSPFCRAGVSTRYVPPSPLARSKIRDFHTVVSDTRKGNEVLNPDFIGNKGPITNHKCPPTPCVWKVSRPSPFFKVFLMHVPMRILYPEFISKCAVLKTVKNVETVFLMYWALVAQNFSRYSILNPGVWALYHPHSLSLLN